VVGGTAACCRCIFDFSSSSRHGYGAAQGHGRHGGYAGKTLYKTLAGFLQYIIPIACLIGAALSVLARRKRGELFARVATQPAPDPLNTMTWPEFEMLVGESFRRQGYAVTEVGGKKADGGVDLVLTRDGQTFLVQCKQWKACKVGVSVVRELFGVMAAEKAAGGFVVTSGRVAGVRKRKEHSDHRWTAFDGNDQRDSADAASNSCGGGHFFRYSVSKMWRGHGSARCEAGRRLWQRLLGLQKFSKVPRHSPHQLNIWLY